MQERLLRLLADGKTHSGTAIADHIGVSRTAVWKHLRQMAELGLDVEARAGSGYRLARPIEMLNEAAIVKELPTATRKNISALNVLWSIDSTSDWLLEHGPPLPGLVTVCLAEHQTGGRGRGGRRWLSPIGSGICLSQSLCFQTAPRDLAALSLVAGLAVMRALHQMGVTDTRVKWPNDVVADAGKVAGILVDVAGEADGPLHVVIGVGVNFWVSEDLLAAVREEGGMPPLGVIQLANSTAVSRNKLAALLIGSLDQCMEEFGEHGFAPFASEWDAHDCLRNQPVTVHGFSSDLDGIARGVGADGRLQLECNGEVQQMASGDVSLRGLA